MILAVLSLVAALAAVPTPPAEVSNVRFGSSKLMLAKAKTGSTLYLRGPLRVDMSFKKPQARKPILRIACLCEVNGVLTCYSGLWDKLNTNRKLERSEIAQAFKAAGAEPPAAERAAAYADPKRISPLLSEVLRDKYARASYGDTSENGGFFRIGGGANGTRLLLCRFELWQNGHLVGSSDSSRAGLGAYDIPDDWHVWKKYPQKFKYVDAL